MLYFLISENMNAEQRIELNELLSSEPDRRRGRAALVARLGGSVVKP